MAPLPSFVWREQQQVMVPLDRHRDRCRALRDGRTYRLVEQRSKEEHNQFFAVCAEAFAQFPEDVTRPICMTFETEENQLRKFRSQSLIKCGFCSHSTHNCVTEDRAAFVASIIARREPFSDIKNYGTILKIYVPESMVIDDTGEHGMTRARFRKAKQACFEYWAHTIGVSVDELVEQAKGQRHTP